MLNKTDLMKFLSIQAQDFIEEGLDTMTVKIVTEEFLSIQAQDFIEDWNVEINGEVIDKIPEHSSSGLH